MSIIDIEECREIAKKAQRTSPGGWKADCFDGISEFVLCKDGPVIQTIHEDAPKDALFEVRGFGRGAFEDIFTYVEHFQPSFVLQLLAELEELRAKSKGG